MTHTSIDASDYRRALAMITHREREFYGGIKVVLEEAVAAGRVTYLLIALCDTYDDLVPLMRTETAQRMLAQGLEMILEHGKPDWRRATAVIMARALRDKERFDALLAEANESEPGALFLGLLDVYCALLPELATDLGLELLAGWTNVVIGEEIEQ